MSIGYHKTGKMSIDTADFCEYFRRPVWARIYWQYPRPRKTPHRKEGTPMKIVILRTPPLIAPILRRMFGIRKEKKR